ncbi:hypothetical protein P168DRAFT_307409 [Aspergillus campestris IBT 28561]|uniref:Uncharacterized protein n=1 Tax=Aspergillus campestris (strain IBT 28561) TaxID=1392248 RepID=A0A2I1CS81_ASPC2|nr:uncharacterized protein P168DRAFT_307409 [Aspergillus campestris IBT 28561]PKY00471.1 hypothetical protein P168DRAFT_307409 [Aspergillus campestris IBT 28561]
MAEQLLRWLNGQVDLRIAYSFTLDEIVACLQDIVNRPGVYGIPSQCAEIRMSIHQNVTRLRSVIRQHYKAKRGVDIADFYNSCPDGSGYLIPPPSQSIAREANPHWPSAVASLRLIKWKHEGIAYWALPDLLGLFMSSLGSAPTGATKRNFYLPLTAVFGQWCMKLLGEGKWPAIFQCTWTEAGEYCPGASRGGFATRGVGGSWLAVLDRARYGVIRSPLLTLANWSQTWTPTIRASRGRGTPFGRCGETYPFRRVLVTCRTGEEAGRVHGLALSSRYVNFAHLYDDRLSGFIWRGLVDPCANCQFLIRLHNGDVTHFNKADGREGAPP